MGYKFEKYSIGGGGGSGIIDVTELPEVGVEGSVYRITTTEDTAEVYVMSGGTCLTLTKYFENTTGMTAPITARYIVVDTLPETLEGMDQETMKVAVYVIRSTGALYWDMQGTGTATLLLDDLNAMGGWSLEAKGLAESAEAITEDGTYVVITAVNFYQFFIYKNSEWRELLEEVDDFAYVLNEDDVSYGVSCNNRTKYGTFNIETEHDGMPVTKILTLGFADCGATKITVPDNILEIGDMAFEGCASMESIEFGENSELTKIGEDGLSHCFRLLSVTIPKGVTSIGAYAFRKCASLAWVQVATPSNMASIGAYAFANCCALQHFTVPTGVTSIGDSAFNYCCDMTYIVIPNSVTSIGVSAFNRCYCLADITYNGTKEQWKAITFGTSWDNDTPDYIITCTDGTIAKDGTES